MLSLLAALASGASEACFAAHPFPVIPGIRPKLTGGSLWCSVDIKCNATAKAESSHMPLKLHHDVGSVRWVQTAGSGIELVSGSANMALHV